MPPVLHSHLPSGTLSVPGALGGPCGEVGGCESGGGTGGLSGHGALARAAVSASQGRLGERRGSWVPGPSSVGPSGHPCVLLGSPSCGKPKLLAGAPFHTPFPALCACVPHGADQEEAGKYGPVALRALEIRFTPWPVMERWGQSCPGLRGPLPGRPGLAPSSPDPASVLLMYTRSA